MADLQWTEDFPAAITICDATGKVIYMNRKAVLLFRKSGGEQLIGTSILDCHPAPARTRVQKLLDGQGTAVFTVVEGRVKRIVYDAPWYSKGKYCGLVELSFPLPRTFKNFVRDEESVFQDCPSPNPRVRSQFPKPKGGTL